MHDGSRTCVLLLCGVLLAPMAAWANTAPKARGQSIEVVSGSAGTTVYLSYKDPDYTAPRTYTLVSAPTGGELEHISGGQYVKVAVGKAVTTSSWRYTESPGFTGQDSFTWKMSDGGLTSNVATFKINVVANTPPKAHSMNTVAVSGDKKTIPAVYDDPNASQKLTVTLVSGPSSGAVTSSGDRFYYTSGAGFVGKDSFTWKVSDGVATSATATCNVRVRSVGERAGTLVVLVVEGKLLPEIQAEVNRLKADLTQEGNAVKIKPWTSSSAADLWAHLRGEHTLPGQFLSGAIFIGRLPLAKVSSSTKSYTSDFFFWNLARKGLTSKYTITNWVSRFNGAGGLDEVPSLKRALQANHDYRTGAHRLPHTGYHYAVSQFDTTYRRASEQKGVLEVWPTQEFRQNHLAWARGGDLLKSLMHGSQLSGQLDKFNGHPIQVRFNCMSSCGRGRLGGVSNQMILSRGGGGVFGVGATTTTYVGAFDMLGGGSDKVAFRARLAAGDSWGAAMTDHHPFADTYRAMYYGDLSLPAMAAPANKVPAVTTFSAKPAAGVAPLSVAFSAAASDADGSIASYEWFPLGYHRGRASPTVSTSATHGHTYTLPYRYLAEVQVVDSFKARGWKEQTVVVKPTPGQPLRIQSGTVSYAQRTYWPGAQYVDKKGHVWLHDQKYVGGDGTWGLEKGDKTGKTASDIDGTDDDPLFQSYRLVRKDRAMTYRIPVANGTYTVWAGFAEPSTKTAVGARLTDVDLEGKPWLVAHDARAKAGAARKALFASKTVTVSDGEVTVAVKRNAASSLDAVISCLAVFPGVSQGPAPPGGGPTAPPDAGPPPPSSDSGNVVVPPPAGDSGATTAPSPDAGGSPAPPPPPPPPPPPHDEPGDDADRLLTDAGVVRPHLGDAAGSALGDGRAPSAAAPSSSVLQGGCSMSDAEGFSGWGWLVLLGLAWLPIRRRVSRSAGSTSGVDPAGLDLRRAL